MKINICIIIATISAILGFVLAAQSVYHFSFGLIGTVLISIQQGIGECSLLAYSSFFGPSCIAAWSTGTGLAGLSSSFLYLVLTSILHVSHELIIWCFSVIPFLFYISFWVLKPTGHVQIEDSDDFISKIKVIDRIKLLKPHLLLYFSLYFVFLFEYSIM